LRYSHHLCYADFSFFTEMIALQKILIAHPAEEFTGPLAAALRARYDVRICYTGPDALTMLDTLRPDILVIHLSLPILTGLDVLRNMCHRPEVIVAITNIAISSVIDAAAEAGVDVIFPMPCRIRAVARQINALANRKIPLSGP